MDASTDMPICDHTLEQRWGPGGATGKSARHICALHYIFNNCGFITGHFSGTSLGLNFIVTVMLCTVWEVVSVWKINKRHIFSSNCLWTSSRYKHRQKCGRKYEQIWVGHREYWMQSRNRYCKPRSCRLEHWDFCSYILEPWTWSKCSINIFLEWK